MSPETYAVLREPIGKMDIGQAAMALAKAFARLRVDVARELRDRPGILAEGLTRAQAEQAAVLLRQSGIGVFVMAESQMAIPPEPIEIREGKLAADGFAATTSAGPLTAPWNQIILLDCARVKHEEFVQTQEIQMTANYDARHVGTFEPPVRTRQELRSSWKEFLDVICYEPWLHLRIDRNEFRYHATGLPVRAVSYENFSTLLRAFKTRATNAALGPGVALLLDGDPRTRLASSSLKAHENHILWRLQLIWRKEP